VADRGSADTRHCRCRRDRFRGFKSGSRAHGNFPQCTARRFRRQRDDDHAPRPAALRTHRDSVDQGQDRRFIGGARGEIHEVDRPASHVPAAHAAVVVIQPDQSFGRCDPRPDAHSRPPRFNADSTAAKRSAMSVNSVPFSARVQDRHRGLDFVAVALRSETPTERAGWLEA